MDWFFTPPLAIFQRQIAIIRYVGFQESQYGGLFKLASKKKLRHVKSGFNDKQ